MIFTIDVEKKTEKINNRGVVPKMDFAIVYKCEYLTDIDVRSDEFAIRSVGISGSLSGSGDLTDGFELVLGRTHIVLGAEMSVNVKWSVTRLTQLSFWLKECSVTNGEMSIAVISEGCYSEALQVARRAQTATNMGFAFRTFMLENATGINYY